MHMATIPLSFLVSALLILSAFAVDDVFVSIDCGSSGSHTDEKLIVWEGDDAYRKTGESRSVPPNNSISRAMDTLRVFTTRRKNCYQINSVRQGRVLVRASFYYGNYDDRSSPPTFDLQFDGNDWATVETSSTEYVYYEVIYVLKRNSISVCVAQTRQGEFPFMSALEVRGLDAHMYNYIDSDYPLHLMRRFAYGANATIRFIDDPFDRIWTPAIPRNGSGLTVLSSNTSFGFLGLGDMAPPAVLQNAVTAIQPNASINLFTGFPAVEIPVYMTWYFSEVSQLRPNQIRSFTIIKDGLPFSQPIFPPFANMTELYISNLTVSSNTSFSLVPTNISTLPPLINAMEILLVGDMLTNGTNSNDVEGLASLQKAFDVLQGWSGDPCLPAPYSWDWINCSTDSIPRVTALLLSSFGLSGRLPDFKSMDALETIDLHNNSLNGTIPDFLGSLPNLHQLNLGDNQFTGVIPSSLSGKNGLDLVATGNSGLCTSINSCTNSRSTNSSQNSSGTKKNRDMLGIILIGTILVFFIIL